MDRPHPTPDVKLSKTELRKGELARKSAEARSSSLSGEDDMSELDSILFDCDEERPSVPSSDGEDL